MAARVRWCRAIITEPDGTPLTALVLEGDGAPDMETVDRVARLLLVSARWGARVRLVDVCAALQELLELAGLPVDTGGPAADDGGGGAG